MSRTSGIGIGEIARRAGVAPSAIRYYEGLGLLPVPTRAGGKRRYDETVLDWLALIALAREAGFTMAELRELVAGAGAGASPAERWRRLATRKLAEVDALVAHATRMRGVLMRALGRGCLRLEDCGRALAAGGDAGRDAERDTAHTMRHDAARTTRHDASRDPQPARGRPPRPPA
jgi:MerR family transcriptional regulator, redox-sensitive transcriptional activator SoxR